MKTLKKIYHEILQNKLRYISIAIAIIVFGTTFFSDKIKIFSSYSNINNKAVIVEYDNPRSKYNYLWWELNGNRLVLKEKKDFNGTFRIYSLSVKDELYEITTNELDKRLDSLYKGTFLASSNEFKADIDGSGVKEIFVNAKMDTLLVQGFVPTNTFFKLNGKGLEVVRQNDHQLNLYYNNNLLKNKNVLMVYTNGVEENYTIGDDGLINIPDVRDIRNGLTFVYKNEDNSYYISNYMLESRQLFNSEHFNNMKPLIIAIMVSYGIIFIFIILFIPKRPRKIISFIENKKL